MANLSHVLVAAPTSIVQYRQFFVYDIQEEERKA